MTCWFCTDKQDLPPNPDASKTMRRLAKNSNNAVFANEHRAKPSPPTPNGRCRMPLGVGACIVGSGPTPPPGATPNYPPTWPDPRYKTAGGSDLLGVRPRHHLRNASVPFAKRLRRYGRRVRRNVIFCSGNMRSATQRNESFRLAIRNYLAIVSSRFLCKQDSTRHRR